MLSRIWAENKRFLLIAGSSLALFLILNSCVSSYARRVEGPTGLHARSTRLAREIRQLHKEVGIYNEVKSLLAKYAEQEGELRTALELPAEKELAEFDDSTPLLQFEKAVDRVWEQALERANRAGVALPEKVEARDFRVARDDDQREYESHYAYLGILRRALSALIASGKVAQIPYHLNRAMDHGLTQAQAGEVITHLACYAGWPNAFSALPVAKDVFERRPD